MSRLGRQALTGGLVIRRYRNVAHWATMLRIVSGSYPEVETGRSPLGGVLPTGPAENDGILANGERQFSISS
jgi:hypothetical protein